MSTVYGMDSMIVGKIETRATNQICSRISRQAHGRRTIVTSDSTLSTKNWPSAFMGFAMARPFTDRLSIRLIRPPIFAIQLTQS